MERSTSTRIVLEFLAVGVWVFLLVALGSFHYNDWPSHEVFPYPPIQNLCGSVGAFISYHVFLTVGQGAFPVMFFTGVCLVMLMCNNRIGDLWMRAVGLLLLTVAFAATVHHFKPGSYDGFPEGRGGIVGISVATVLQHYFSTVGTRLILLTTALVGLLLAADDLVLRTPGVVGGAIATVKDKAPKINWNFVNLPKLPALPQFVTRDAIKSRLPGPKKSRLAESDLDGEIELKPSSPKKDKPGKTDKASTGSKPAGPIAPLSPELVVAGVDEDEDDGIIDLSYKDDEPEITAADDAAHMDDADPAPSEAAVIPPPEEQAPEPAPLAPPPPKMDIVVKLPNLIKPKQTAPPPPKELGDYHLPAWDCLADAEHGYAESQEAFVREQAAILEQALREFSIDAQVVEIDTGPVITMYEISLAPGIKVSAITALSNDIMRALKAESVRIVAPVPGKNTVGIEVPNAQKEKVRLKELMQTAPPNDMAKMSIPLFLGKDAS